MSEPEQGAGGSPAPLLRVIAAGATDEEVAALVAVVASLAAAPAEPTRRPTPAWSDHRRRLTRMPAPGPGAWRASGLP